LIGRGSDDDANRRYKQMNKAFENSGLSNIRIAAIDAKPDIEDALEHLKAKGSSKKVVIHPFLVASGEKVREKIAGDTDSIVSRLKAGGYDVEVILKGLGEYPEFRNIYINRLKAVL
jgi:sirohydrochlorin cobaltochelatase